MNGERVWWSDGPADYLWAELAEMVSHGDVYYERRMGPIGDIEDIAVIVRQTPASPDTPLCAPVAASSPEDGSAHPTTPNRWPALTEDERAAVEAYANRQLRDFVADPDQETM